MNRRKFALSWGRKLFFGLSWPLSLLLTIVYLRSFILPQDAGDWFYYITTFIGHTGLLNALVYFLLYCPIILLMPSYYVSRFWSLLLILALNLVILLDALSFSSYHFHIYSFLSKLYLEEGFNHLLGSDAGVIILSVGTAVFALLIWLRGEMIWRGMQARFSNPVSNWYFALIVFFLGASHLTYHYGDIPPKLPEVFTFNKHFPKPPTTNTYARKFYYPVENLQCQGKSNPNVVFIVIRNWGNDQYNPETMPTLFHMKRHAQSYNSHSAVGMDSESGMFSLLYSVPASYKAFAGSIKPALFTELDTRKYEVLSFGNGTVETSPLTNDEKTIEGFRQWLENRSGEEINPYFLFATFDQHASEVDKFVREITVSLEKENLLHGTHFVITGAHSDSGNIPLLIVSPDRRTGEFAHTTSQYDLVPTLMQKWWGCKKSFKNASIGLPLDQTERDWLLVSDKDKFKIVDYKNNNVTTVQDGVITNSSSVDPRNELIFAALKTMTSFTRSR